MDDLITDEMVELVAKAIHDTDDMADTVWPSHDNDDGYRGGNGYLRLCRNPDMFRGAARAALTAALPMIRAGVVEEQRKRFSDPHSADWYWRDLDPDDSGDSISEAIHMMGEGVVCHIRSSFTGPDFFAAIVPVLDTESDNTEEMIADTAEECTRMVQERYAAIRALGGGE